MRLLRRLRRRLLASALITGLMFQPVPAQAIPVAAVGLIGLTGFAATVATFVINTAISIAISKLLSPKVKSNRQAAVQTLQVGEQSRAAIVGECAVAGSLLHAFNYGGKYGTDWEMRIVAVADHRCEALSGFYVNDKYVAFAGDGIVSGYNSQLKIWWMPGTESQTLPAELLANCPYLSGTATRSWTADDNCAGMALFIAAYKADQSDAKNPIWTAGRPAFLPVVKGALLYDPRKDSSVAGGSGAHRWDDPSTREWDDNLIVARYNWVRGFYACDRIDQPDMLLVGRGLSATEAPPERIFAAANLCDEIAEDGEKRWKVAATIYATDSFIDTEEAFAAACAGQIVQPEGGVEIIPGHAQSVVMEITDDDLLLDDATEYEAFRGHRDDAWVNTVVARYVEPAMKWGDHAAPVRRVVADVIADRKPREETLSMQFCTRVNQAQYAAEYKRRLGRLQRTATIPLGPRFIGLEEGDWIGWTSDRRMGGDRRVFQIQSWSFDRSRKSKRILREIAASVFGPVDLIADSAVANQPLPPDTTGAPDSDEWALSADATLAESGISLLLNFVGAAEADEVTSILFDYATGASAPDADDDAAWTYTGSAPGYATAWSPIMNDADSTYWGAVSYTLPGGRTDRLIIGPVTFNTAAIAPRPTTDTVGTGGAGELTIDWRNPGSANYGFTRLYYGASSSFGSATALTPDDIAGTLAYRSRTFGGIAPGSYYVWSRAYSSAGSPVAAAPHRATATVTVT